MKKVSFILLLLILGVSFTGFSQAPATSDLFASKWEITVLDTRQIPEWGFSIELIRKEGKLTAKPDTYTISNPFTFTIKIGRVEEVNATKLVLYLDIPENERQGLPTKDIPMELTKVDNDILKGKFMESDIIAKRKR